MQIIGMGVPLCQGAIDMLTLALISTTGSKKRKKKNNKDIYTWPCLKVDNRWK